MPVSRPTTPTLLECLATIPDPRVERTKKHRLVDILALTILATLCGADTWVHVADFGRSREAWLRQFLPLPHGIPSHDTLARVFGLLDPIVFQQQFLHWVRVVADLTAGAVVAIDGKALRAARQGDRRSGRPLHLVSAWATAQGVCLGQVAVDAKSNEIPAIPELLQQLAVQGAIVTVDAAGCQTEVATAIRARQADYVLALKGNQTTLHARAVTAFAEFAAHPARAQQAIPHVQATTIEKDHGRLEVRRYTLLAADWVVADPTWRAEWRALTTIGCVERTRTLLSGPQAGTTTQDTQYYLTSLPLHPHARDFVRAARGHWAIENQCHWLLDVVFDEDRNRTRDGIADQNLALLRKHCLTLLRHESTARVGTAGKRLRCGWDPDYLRTVLQLAPI